MNFPHPYRRRPGAFTLIELLVAVTIMTLIIFVLYSLFNQTQRAMRANNVQVDVLESGRAAVELMSREMEEMAASYGGKYYPLPINLSYRQTNFYSGQIPLPAPPLRHYDVDDQTFIRTNVIQEFFFLNSRSNYWTGIGYRVLGADQGVGTLFRYQTPLITSLAMPVYPFASNFFVAAPPQFVTSNLVTRAIGTNFNRVADGIVHLRIRAYDTDGYELAYNTRSTNQPYSLARLNADRSWIGAYSTATEQAASAIAQQDAYLGAPLQNENRLTFVSNAVPAYVELELGVLEPEAFKRYQALKENPGDSAIEFLRKQSAKVHLFRQRIPIRTVTQ